MKIPCSIPVNDDNFETVQKIVFKLGYKWAGTSGFIKPTLKTNYNFYLNLEHEEHMFYNDKKFYTVFYILRYEKLKKLIKNE